MGLLYTFLADGEGKLLSTHVADPSNQYALQWDYSDFRLVDDHPFPQQMNVEIFKERQAAGRMNFHFSRIQTDVPVNIEFSVPSKYKRITLAKVLKSIGGK